MNGSVVKKKIANLDVFEVKGTEGGPVIILLHGFGANAQDLLPLHQYIKAPKGTTWIFPDAPMEISLGGGHKGRAWFELLSSAIDHVVRKGSMDFSELTPPGIDKANAEILKLMEEIKSPFEKITLGGFSQGSMLATDVTLRLTDKTAGLAILSGTLISKNEWALLAQKKNNLQFFQSHGTEDPVLPYQGGKNLEAMLRESGLSGEFVSFQGGHTIPDTVAKRMGQYLLR